MDIKKEKEAKESPARILVVDDHPSTAMTLARAIAQSGGGKNVISATNGKRALEYANDAPIDVLITDMIMPDMNGLELIERLQSGPGGRPMYTILITAYDIPGLKETARRLRVKDVLIKPIPPQRICQIIEQALGDLGKPQISGPVLDPQNRFKILITDDYPDNVSLLSRYLKNEGYDYITAYDGVEALRKVRAEFPDLILLDLNMPEKDGLKVLQELRADPAIEHIPVIVLTAARISPADMQHGLNLGADDYVTKPFDRIELLARIRTKLRVKSYEDIIRRRNKELNILPEIGRELSARLDLHELSELVLRRTVETMGAMAGHLLILNFKNPIHKEYHISVPGDPQTRSDLPPLNELLRQIKENHESILIKDTLKDPRWGGSPDNPARSAVIVPMVGRYDLIGLLALVHEGTGYFNEEHRVLLQAIASQASIAVENAGLYADIAQERHTLGAVLQSAADAIMMFDPDGCLSMLNPAAEKLFTDYEPKIGLPLARSSGYDELILCLEEAHTSEGPISKEIVWPDQRVFNGQFTPTAKSGCVVVLHDVSQFKTLERVKNEFISTASHDLRNPLTSIAGFSDLMTKVGPLNEQQMEFANRIQSAAEFMGGLVEELFDLAKMDMGMELKKEVIDVVSLVAEIAEEFQAQAQAKGQTLRFKGTTSRPVVQGDPLRLRQVFRNLLGNAVKYTPASGSVILSIQTTPDHATIHIQDTGYGIPTDDLPFIFDRFYRVHNEAVKDIEGNGLGLAIVKSIIEGHGGQVNVESKPGEGSCFTCSLPLIKQDLPLDVNHDLSQPDSLLIRTQ